MSTRGVGSLDGGLVYDRVVPRETEVEKVTVVELDPEGRRDRGGLSLLETVPTDSWELGTSGWELGVLSGEQVRLDLWGHLGLPLVQPTVPLLPVSCCTLLYPGFLTFVPQGCPRCP